MTNRTANPRILPLVIERWSPRSFDGTPVPEEDLLVMIEAAGWAPSAFNVQPWTFLHARPGDAHWDRFLSLLVPFNQSWAKDAGALLFIVSQETSGSEGQPLYSHSFDAGAAWALLAIQAQHMGWHSHGMTGIDFDRARAELAIPEGYRLEAAVAIGRKAPAERLPEPLREREAPAPRKPVAEIAVAGTFPAP
ncbi:MAG: hypothetical protein RIQ46_1763 [Pseudomonadota bacterium]|jgi:nitroreductase